MHKAYNRLPRARSPEPSSQAAASKAAPAQATEVAPPPRQTKKSSKKSKRPMQVGLTRTHIGPDQYGQEGATTAAKRDRKKASGLDTRMLGHVSSRGKRSQARRDAKN